MSIGRKLLLLLLLFGVVLLACVYALADYFLLRNVRRAEKMEVTLQLERARRVFDAEAASLSGLVEDWSAWDDTCRFLSDTNREYIASNLPEELYEKSRVQLILFVNQQGMIVYGRHLWGDDKAGGHLLGGALSSFEGFGWLSGVQSITNGVVKLPGGLAFLAAAPVLNSHYNGPARGLLVMARYLDPVEQDYLSRLYGVSLHGCEASETGGVVSACAQCRPQLDIPLHLMPMNGAAPVSVMIRTPHMPLHDQALSDRYIMLGSLLVLYVLVCGFAALVVRRCILRRLNHLAEFVRLIDPNKPQGNRVAVDGADELTLLSEAVNRMLDDMEKAQAFEKKVREVQKMQALGDLAVGIAHDFNNMLYVITGYTSMIAQRIKDDPVSCEYLERTEKAVELSSSLIRQLMSFGQRDEHGAFRISLGSIIKESILLFQASLPASIQIRQHLVAAPDMIRADPAQIFQMLMNLYFNAFHAMREKGGVITITTEWRQPEANKMSPMQKEAEVKWICLSVADTGSGICAEDIGRIFDPYFTTKSVGEGSGLGLSVVHRIVETAGGIIQVESQVGQGSVFSVFFHLDETEDYQPSAAQVERAQESSSMPKT